MGIIQFVKVSIEYNQMMDQAQRLEDAADQCSEAAAKIRSKTADMLDNWQGDAATAMFQKLVDILKESNAIQQELRTAAAQLRRKAEAIKSVDDSAASSLGK